MKILSIITCCIFVAGCSPSNLALYKKSSWTAPSVESDWDIASTICEEVALKAKATKQQQEEAKQQQDLAKSMASTGGGSPAVDLAHSIMSGLMPSLVEEGAKNEAFANCMTERGWKENA